jgi:hypothetical protein
MTDSEHCRDQKSEWSVGFFPIQTFHSDLSTARVSGGRESELDCWLGYCYCSPERVSRRPSYIYLPFITFQMLTFDNHCYVAVFKAIYVNIIILVVAVLRYT